MKNPFSLTSRHKNIDVTPLEDLLKDPMWIRIFNEHDESEPLFYKMIRKVRLFLNM